MRLDPLISVVYLICLARAQRVSVDGTCGNKTMPANTCLSSTFGSCCSQYGFCGSAAPYCGVGCQAAFGSCRTSTTTQNPQSSPASQPSQVAQPSQAPPASQTSQTPQTPPIPQTLQNPQAKLTIIATRWPDLIIPITRQAANQAGGTQYSGHISYGNGGANEIATEVAFDNIPSNKATTCRLNFYLSLTGPFSISGSLPWSFNIFPLVGGLVGQTDSWNHHPAQIDSIANVTYTTANNALVPVVSTHTVPCIVGRAQYILRAPKDFDFTWFELSDPQNNIKNGIVYEMLG